MIKKWYKFLMQFEDMKAHIISMFAAIIVITLLILGLVYIGEQMYNSPVEIVIEVGE